MTTDRDMIVLSTVAFLGLTRVQRDLAPILTAMSITDVDGYPTSSIGAAPATPGPPQVFEGRCKETLEVTEDGKIVCSTPRPCPDHDGPVELTSVEQAALRQKQVQARRETEILLRRIASDVSNLQRVVKPYLPKVDPPNLCNRGAGRDGVVDWQWIGPNGETCANVAEHDRGGLCLRCSKREYRWRQAHGLPSRNAA